MNRPDQLAAEPEQLPDPPKLFRVQRIAPMKHRIYWEKKILFDLGIINDVSVVVVVNLNRFTFKHLI